VVQQGETQERITRIELKSFHGDGQQSIEDTTTVALSHSKTRHALAIRQ
jgi:hypothetical protein